MVEGLADVMPRPRRPPGPSRSSSRFTYRWADPRPNDQSSTVPSWVPRLLPASRSLGHIRKRTSTLTKRLWLTLARLPSAVSAYKEWTRSSTLAQGQPGQGCPVRPSEGRRTAGRLRALDDLEATFEVGKSARVATRGASGSVLNAIAAVMPELWATPPTRPISNISRALSNT